MKGRKASLLDDDDDVVADHQELRVNKSFADRFEHNKRREELHRLQAKHPELATRIAHKALTGGPDDDDVADSSDEEEEDEGEIPDETEAQIFETLLRIRRKDPAIYDPKVHFFADDDDEDGGDEEQEGQEGGGGGQGKKQQRPQYLKDVLAKQALEHGPDAGSSSEEEGDGGEERGGGARRPRQAYDPEQEQLRREFLLSAAAAEEQDGEEQGGEGEGDFGAVLRKKPREPRGSDDEQEEENGAGGKRGGKGARKRVQQLVVEVFKGAGGEQPGGGDGDAGADAFLRDFILNKGWIDRKASKSYVPSYHEVVGEEEEDEEAGEAGVDDEDEAHLEQVDRFEAAYNFRFEEPGGAAIVSHPRQVEGSVRHADDRRRKQREARKQRQREELSAHDAEVRRLKNLKRREIEDKLAQVAKVAGVKSLGDGDGEEEDEEDEEDEEEERKAAAKKGKKAGAGKRGALQLDPALLDGDFDPEEWDRKMAEAFGDEYYEGEEEDLPGLLSRDAEQELEQLVGPVDDEDEEQEEEEEGGVDARSFAALRKKLAAGGVGAAGTADGDGDGDGQVPADAAAVRAELQRLLEEYYRLDHEGVAGGVKTRFRYREVPGNTFGLSVEDILNASDKDLNQVVGMKRLTQVYADEYGGGGGKAQHRPNYKALQELRQQRQQQNRGGSRRGADAWHSAPRKQAHPQPEQEEGTALDGGEGGAPHVKKHKRPPGTNGKDAHQHKRQQGGRGSGAAPAKQLDPEAARRASYAPLALPGKAPPHGKGDKGGSGQQKKRKQEEQGGGGKRPRGDNKAQGEAAKPAPAAPVVPVDLPKSQRKNLKRALKRAQAKGGAPA